MNTTKTTTSKENVANHAGEDNNNINDTNKKETGNVPSLLISTTEIEIPLPASGGRTIRGIRYKRKGFSGDSCDKNNSNGVGNSINNNSESSSSRCNRWILLHGWLDNAASFDRFIPFFFQHYNNFDNSDDLDIVALDMSGHGRSDHRKASYHVVDFVADTVQCADVLFGGNEVPFNVLGHSLGAGVAFLVAGMAAASSSKRRRIPRLVMIDSLGPFSMGDPRGAPFQLAKSCAKTPSLSSSLSKFRNVQEAAERRAKKNVVPDRCFTVDHAAVICARGLRSVEEGVLVPDQKEDNGSKQHDDNDDDDDNERETINGVATAGTATKAKTHRLKEKYYTWSSDPWLLSPTRAYLSESAIRAFAASSTSETLILLAQDGALARLISSPFFPSFDSYAFACAASIATGVLSFALWCMPQSKTRRKLETFQKGLRYVQRVRFLGNRKTVLVPKGGHHPHLTEPALVASELGTWIEETNHKVM